MRVSHILTPALAAVTLLLVACAPAPLYKPAADAVHASPARVAQVPENYANGAVIWGGRIIKVTNLTSSTRIELLSYPLDKSQRPQTDEGAQGRFIVEVPGYLEPLNYPPGQLMTISGNLLGTRDGHVGGATYVFPLVHANDYHLWTAKELRSAWSNVHIGVGIGAGFR